jgi:2-acylglycerol O-acyltransferase 2
MQVKVTTVIGKPIEVPQSDAPSREEVQHWLNVFIEAMAALFERHKAAAGYPDLKLLIV